MTATEIRTFLKKVGKATRPEMMKELGLSYTCVRMGMKSLRNRDEIVMCGYADGRRTKQWSLK